jgi:hypothetical protein
MTISTTASLIVNPFITILSHPQNDVTAVGSRSNFFVDAKLSDDRFGELSYQWQLNTQNLTDTDSANAIIRGSKKPGLIVTPTPEVPGISTVRVVVSNPSAKTVISNSVTLNVVDLRNILVIEGFTPENNYAIREIDLSGGANFTLTDETFGSNFNIITFYAPENDLDIEMEIRASKGSDRGSYTGGQGGTSKIRTTLRRNDEYTVLGISNNSGVFIYRGANLISVVGKGGDAGSIGNGGAGGGVSNSGENGSGRGAGTGGARLSANELALNGIFGSVSTTTNILSGDSKAGGTDGGKTISCPKGSYWTGRTILPCNNIGTTQFHNTDGTLISQSALINRGFKPGYTITTTGGKALSTGGNGGVGATGGSGGNEGGGGGGSGYSDGSYTIFSSTSGGNNTFKSTINFKIYVPPPPPPPPPPSPSSVQSQATYNGVAGGVNQNAGFSQSQVYSGGTSAVIGASAVQRAVSSGFSVSEIQAWVNRTGATVGPQAQALGIKPARR